MHFSELGLAEPILRAVTDAGYETPTPIQAQAIPPALRGQDIFGCAQTGTGKTAAFVMPILHQLRADGIPRGKRPLRCLILTPTRELAAQIGESIADYGAHLDIHHSVIYGGVGQHPQVSALRRGLDILVACPGRLLDLMGQGYVDLRDIDYFVLDEADRMLDMGFIHDVRKIIVKLPKQRQTLFFSATVPREIRELADSLLIEPVEITVTPTSSTAETVEQCLYHVPKRRKVALLKHLLKDKSLCRCLVFTRTKHGADRVCKQLNRENIRSEAIHGNKSQNARIRALENFKAGKARVLVASDIAARGIDIDEVSHVVNFELPHEPETYVHRIGRTGRAGNEGRAISFCQGDEIPRLKGIQRLIKQQITVIEDHPYANMQDEEETAAPQQQPRRPAARPQGQGRSRRPGQPKQQSEQKSSDGDRSRKRRPPRRRRQPRN